MIKAVIFDMDGLMFDSELLGIKITEEVMSEYPYEFDKDLNMRIIGTNEAFIQNEYRQVYGADFPFKEVWKKKKERTIAYYEENDIPKKTGLIELLDFLKKQHLKLGVATSTERVKTEYILKKAGIYSYFDNIVCGDEVNHSKPNPEIYLKSVQALQVKPEEALVLEDSENGLRAAHSAGIRTVFIKDLVSPLDEVLANVTYSVKSLHEVPSLIAK